ncbi:unnamed protein product [Urochloa humidicola]
MYISPPSRVHLDRLGLASVSVSKLPGLFWFPLRIFSVCVVGERDLLVGGVRLVLLDSIFCGGFDTNGYVTVFVLCVGNRFLRLLPCAVGVHGIISNEGLVSYDMVVDDWRGLVSPGGLFMPLVLVSLLSIFGNCVGDSAISEGASVRFVYSYLEKSGWSSFAGVASLLGDLESPAVLGAPDLLRLGDGNGRSMIIVCIDFFGVPLVAKVGFKKLVVASLLEASSSSWSSASSRKFGVPFIQGDSVGWRPRSPAMRTTGVVLQELGCICYSFMDVLVTCECTLLYQ